MTSIQGLFYQYDRKAKKLVQVAAQRPSLTEDLMASTKRLNIPVTDGSYNSQLPNFTKWC